MSAITHNTIVFFGPNQEIENINTFLESWNHPTERSREQQTNFSTLQVDFDTAKVPPLKQLDDLYRKFPSLGNVHRIIDENRCYETTLLERNPTKGFRKCFIDDPNGYEGYSGFTLFEDFRIDLENQVELRVACEKMGININWINQRILEEIDSP